MEQDDIRSTRRSFLKAGSVAAGTGLVSVGTGTAATTPGESAGRTTQIGTWATASQGPDQPGLVDETIRNIVRTSVGGDGVRVRLANSYSDGPVTFEHVTVGVSDGGAAIVDGTLRTVTFGDSETVTIQEGARAYSDPVDLSVEPEQELAISIYQAEPTGEATIHSTTRTTNYLASGDNAGDTQGQSFGETTTTWYYVEGVDVVGTDATETVVCFGDSITDGTASSLDANSAYPDVLAERVNDSPLRKSVINLGIAGNQLLNDGIGESGLRRLDRDVLSQAGVSHVVVLIGINDVGLSNEPADAIIEGYKQLVDRVRANGVDIVGATLTPFKGALGDLPDSAPVEYYGPTGYYTDEKEERRQRINEFIRTTDRYDAVVDFDAVVRDPADPERLRPEYDPGDHLHPNDKGYRAMAEAIDLSSLR